MHRWFLLALPTAKSQILIGPTYTHTHIYITLLLAQAPFLLYLIVVLLPGTSCKCNYISILYYITQYFCQKDK